MEWWYVRVSYVKAKGLQQHLPAYGKVNMIGENLKGQVGEMIEHRIRLFSRGLFHSSWMFGKKKLSKENCLLRVAAFIQ